MDSAAKLDSDKDNPISSSIVFRESNSGETFAVSAKFFFNVSPRREYLLDGIFVQKNLPEKPKSADYKRLVQWAWPGTSLEDLESAAKSVEAWIKKNPNKPLLLIISLERAKYFPMQIPQPVENEGKVQYSQLIKRINPIYPKEALQSRISGDVVLQLTVNEEGTVEQIRPISGHPLLTSAALAAVQEWKYSPTLVDGVAVPVITTITVKFGLKKK